MTSGTKTRAEPARRARAGAVVAAMLLALGGLPASARAFELDDLMALMARRPAGDATFTEQRFVKGFDAPLTASGTLSFAAPDRFVRRTLSPRPETLQVEGNTLTLSRDGRRRTLSLDAVPEAALAVEAIRGTLTGNAPALRRQFEARVSGDADRWTLLLVPRDNAPAGSLAEVHLTGRGDAVQSVETRLADGSRSLMSITPSIPASAPAPRP